MDRPYSCSHCSKTFSEKSKLTRHSQIHVSSRPLKCPYCPKTFTLDFNLRTHMRSHTGDKPFHCPYADCTKSCTQLGNLTVHMKQVHGQVRSAHVKISRFIGGEGSEEEEHYLITGTLNQVKLTDTAV